MSYARTFSVHWGKLPERQSRSRICDSDDNWASAFYLYIHDRISRVNQIPSLASLIEARASEPTLGASWSGPYPPIYQDDAEILKKWIEAIVEAVDANLLVSDDADAFKTVPGELGLEHQVCKSHVKRSTEALIDNLASRAGSDRDGSLAAIAVTPEQPLKGLNRLGELVLSRQPEEENALGEMHHRYTGDGRLSRTKRPLLPIACDSCSSAAAISGDA